MNQRRANDDAEPASLEELERYAEDPLGRTALPHRALRLDPAEDVRQAHAGDGGDDDDEDPRDLERRVVHVRVLVVDRVGGHHLLGRRDVLHIHIHVSVLLASLGTRRSIASARSEAKRSVEKGCCTFWVKPAGRR